MLYRSTGYGSLQVWIRYLRTGITFQETYRPSCAVSSSTWKGSAFVIGGGYTWEDVYSEAASRNVIVVGGGTPVCWPRRLPAAFHIVWRSGPDRFAERRLSRWLDARRRTQSRNP